MEKKLRFTYGCELITQNTFQNDACFTKCGQFHNGGSKKTSPNPNPPKTLTLSQTLSLEAYYGEIP